MVSFHELLSIVTIIHKEVTVTNTWNEPTLLIYRAIKAYLK